MTVTWGPIPNPNWPARIAYDASALAGKEVVVYQTVPVGDETQEVMSAFLLVGIARVRFVDEMLQPESRAVLVGKLSDGELLAYPLEEIDSIEERP